MKTVTIELTDKEFVWLEALTSEYNAAVPANEQISNDEMAAIHLSLTIEDIYKLRQKQQKKEAA